MSAWGQNMIELHEIIYSICLHGLIPRTVDWSDYSTELEGFRFSKPTEGWYFCSVQVFES